MLHFNADLGKYQERSHYIQSHHRLPQPSTVSASLRPSLSWCKQHQQTIQTLPTTQMHGHSMVSAPVMASNANPHAWAPLMKKTFIVQIIQANVLCVWVLQQPYCYRVHTNHHQHQATGCLQDNCLSNNSSCRTVSECIKHSPSLSSAPISSSWQRPSRV